MVNRQAGTVRSMGEEAVRQLITESFGDTATLALLDGGEIEARLRELLADDGVDRLFIGGGDGTLASAAALAAEGRVAIGILPLGTMNLMAQTIGMKTDLREALAQLRSAEVKPIDAAEANGRLFLHHVSFGLQPRMVRIRERMGYSSRFTKMLAAVRATLAVLGNPQSQRLSLTIDGTTTEMKTPGLIVSNNLYENAMMLKQARLDEGTLGIYALSPMSLVAFLGLALDVLRGRWMDNVNVSERHGSAVTILRSGRFGRRRHSIKATLDGELVLLDLPLRIASRPAALRLLVPRVDEV